MENYLRASCYSVKIIYLFMMFLLVTNCDTHGGKNNSTTVFAIVGPDAFSIHPAEFNRWNVLVKSNNQVHLFANDAETLASLEGNKHVVSGDKLSLELARALSDTTERLFIFFEGHGAPNGNWCYKSTTECLVTEDVLIDALVSQAKRVGQSLKHVLVVPSSCFNKAIMDRFAKKLKDHQWPFSISYLAQTHEYTCGTQSVAESLINNVIVPLDHITEAELEQFLTITRLNDLVMFQNSLVTRSVPELERELHFEVHNNSSNPDIMLSDFGFDVMMDAWLLAKDKNKMMSFPHGESVQTILQQYELAERFYAHVKRLEFTFPNQEKTVIMVDGDAGRIINEPHLVGINYSALHAIMATHKMQ